jgi:hypothetical protein
LCQAKAIINAVTRESTHILFRLQLRRETALAGKFKLMPVNKGYVTFPVPTVGVRISTKHAHENLVAVRIRYSVSLPVFGIRFHDYVPNTWGSIGNRISPTDK